MRYLTFALGKGRLVNSTMEILKKCGIECEEILDKKPVSIAIDEVYAGKLTVNSEEKDAHAQSAVPAAEEAAD